MGHETADFGQTFVYPTITLRHRRHYRNPRQSACITADISYVDYIRSALIRCVLFFFGLSTMFPESTFFPHDVCDSRAREMYARDSVSHLFPRINEPRASSSRVVSTYSWGGGGAGGPRKWASPNSTFDCMRGKTGHLKEESKKEKEKRKKKERKTKEKKRGKKIKKRRIMARVSIESKIVSQNQFCGDNSVGRNRPFSVFSSRNFDR